MTIEDHTATRLQVMPRDDKPKGRYAHVRPGKHECDLRGWRTGIPERPGALPGAIPGGGGAVTSEADFRHRVLQFIAGGEQTYSSVCYACGNGKRHRALLNGLISSGILRSTKRHRTQWVEVAT
jgi:hypothetical protein